ncbi:hypothetical protein BACI9J_550002 [Bacillus altitudinis]|nr:hypothetical protein BACI9J_550002 [Bacillus altitudinis]
MRSVGCSIGGPKRHEHVDAVVGVEHEAVSFVESASRAAHQHVEPRRAVVGLVEDGAQHGRPDPTALDVGREVEVLDPADAVLVAHGDRAHVAAVDHDDAGQLWLERVAEALSHTRLVEHTESCQVVAQHHGPELDEPLEVFGGAVPQCDVHPLSLRTPAPGHRPRTLARWTATASSTLSRPAAPRRVHRSSSVSPGTADPASPR